MTPYRVHLRRKGEWRFQWFGFNAWPWCRLYWCTPTMLRLEQKRQRHGANYGMGVRAQRAMLRRTR